LIDITIFCGVVIDYFYFIVSMTVNWACASRRRRLHGYPERW
jgi:hypothetical protein